MQIEDERKQGFFERVKQSPAIKKLRGVKNIQIVAIIFIIAVGLIIYSSVTAAKDSGRGDSQPAMTKEELRLSEVLS